MFYCKQCNSLIFERNSNIIKSHLEHCECVDYGIVDDYIYDQLESIFMRNGNKDSINLTNISAKELLTIHNIINNINCYITRKAK